MADVDELRPLVDAEDQGAQILPAPLRLRVAPDDRFLPEVRLDLHPVVRADPFPVHAGPVFGDDALKALLLRSLEEGDAAILLVLADGDVGKVFDQLGEEAFALDQRNAPQVSPT